jgi:predicted enzyme related to lactoylglutathione lyase
MNKHRFVWHDLNTKDLAGSKHFYTEIFGWKLEGDGYLHITAGDQMIGGMRQLGPNEPQPTSWLGYIGVDDVAGAVSTVQRAGGNVFMPATTMDNVGTFAITADPTGGVFAPWKSARPDEGAERQGPPPLFAFAWDELMSTDPARAATFYQETFGWEPKPVDMGGGMTYTLFHRPGTKGPDGGPIGAGGMMKSPPGVPHSFWLPYVHVDNTDERCERATKLGAQITVPPTDIPNVGRLACWLDPQQASIAILQSAR